MTNKPVIIVTGASRGLGAAVARWLGEAGAAVSLVARSKKDLNDVGNDVERLGGGAFICEADVADADACRNVVEKTLANFGRLDALVNNAGIVQPISRIAQTDPDQWRYNFEVNLMGAFHLIHAAVSELRISNGRIVNISSGAASMALENVSAYCVSKAALNHFTRVLAAEEPVITALAVRPGVVDTDMQAYIRDQGPNVMPPEQIAYYTNLKERGELEPPEIPGRAIAWLALHAPKEFSGKYLDYDDPRISRPAMDFFMQGIE
jgi:NAD(P)-dependent dehydrogenase (short-subunit alcohol dehydrogenase family)